MRAALRLFALTVPTPGRFAAGIALGALGVGSAIGLLAVSAWLLSAAALAPPLVTLSIAIASVRAFAIARSGLRYLERLASHDTALRLLAELRARIYAHLEPLAPAGLTAFRRGDLLARLVSDVDELPDVPLRVLHPLAVGLSAAGLAVGLLALLLPSAAAALLVALLTAAVSGWALTRRAARRSEARLAGVRGELSADVVELVRAAPDLVAYGAEGAWVDRAIRRDAELTAIARRGACAAGLGAAVTTVCAGLAVAATLALGAAAVASGELPGVALAVVVLVPLAAFDTVALLAPAQLVLSRALSGGARVLAVLDTRAPVAPPATALLLPAGTLGVQLRNVHARWPTSEPDAPAALAGLDLDLSPGRRLAVVGESGAGKSTLAAVLLRFLEVEHGSYHIGGIDARQVTGDELRRVVGLCDADAHVFNTTIRENLRLARPHADDAMLRQVLQRVRLLSWVDSLPDGLDTDLGEAGARLSGGQRQRLVLARALLADFRVLVLDEPTAHLDPDTAAAVTRDLLATTQGCTMVLITHRLTDLDSFDEVLELHAGRVVRRHINRAH
jgi:thiol reductant ABC exporter CydC subunit